MTAWLTGRFFYFGTWAGIALGRLAARFLPRHWLFRFSDALANIGYRCFSGFRTRSKINITTVFGETMSAGAIEEMARQSLRNILRSCVEVAVALEASDSELRALVPLVGSEHLDSALAKGSGVLVLSAHLGNFFLIGSRLAIEGYPVSVLVNQPRDNRLAKLMEKYRLQVRLKTIQARPRREALKTLQNSLRRNNITVIISDEFRRGRGVEAAFFGRTVIARRGPATVALRTGAAIVPACMVRQRDGSLKLVIEPELELDRSGKGSAQIRENVVRITRWVERIVRAYPDQWNWMNIRSWAMHGMSPTEVHDPLRQAM
jgi:KDO2-lipid IV(A) lauroyltransferase